MLYISTDYCLRVLMKETRVLKLTYLPVVAIELATVDVCPTLQIWLCVVRSGSTTHALSNNFHFRHLQTLLTSKHGNDAQNDLLNALNRTPTFRCLFILRGIVSGRVQNRYAHSPIRINYIRNER